MPVEPSPHFWPFDYLREQGASNAHHGDFDLVEAVKELGLTEIQRALLKRIIERISLVLWFNDDQDDNQLKRGGPHIELVFFWEDAEMMISSVSLFPLFEGMIAERGHIGDDEEIAALEKIKALCDRGIQDRKEQSWGEITSPKMSEREEI
jgi:hypothetical protein